MALWVSECVPFWCFESALHGQALVSECLALVGGEGIHRQRNLNLSYCSFLEVYLVSLIAVHFIQVIYICFVQFQYVDAF